MAQGAYIVYQNKENPKEIVFSINSEYQTEVPEVQQKLHLEIEKALVVIQMLFETEGNDFQIYYNQLLNLAQAGLVGKNAQPSIAYHALQQLKKEIVDKKSGEIKNNYLKKLGIKAFYYGIIPFVLGVILSVLKSCVKLSSELNEFCVLANFFFIWSFCMLGVWLSFGTRKTILNFEDLNILERDRLEPTMRLLFAGFISIIFSLLFYTEMITIEIGNVSSKSISDNFVISIIFGTFLGLCEQVLGKKITQQASSIFNN